MANLVMDGVTLASKSGSDVTIQDTKKLFLLTILKLDQ